MADTWRENAIVQAIQIIADKKIAQAGYDKTYKGVVNKVLDKTTGKYEIKYQDSLIEAYATSSEIYYSEGQEVSFLVPGNDWDRMKTIVGGIENTALTYNEIQETSEKYNKTGPSAVSGKYELSSYGYEYINITDSLGINQEIIDNYVKNGNGLVLGMNVQTSLATSQVGGEYGLVFNLKFKDSVTGAAAVRQYVVNSKDVIGNPYFVTRQTPVERLFEDVDLENLDNIQSVYVYCEKFPQDQSKTDIKDIIISNIRLNGVQVLTQDDLNGYSVHIDYSQTGNILNDEISTVTLKGILKVKGKTISSDVNYYWFRQNGMVLRGHEKYSNYGGDGWECLNHFANGKAVPFTSNSISFTTENGSENPVSAVDKNTRVKCVAVFDYKNTEGFSNVYNKTITTDVYIDSNEKRQGINDNKVDYYLDAGHPTLTCHIEPKEEGKIYKYYWTVVPARGKAESRESDQIKRADYLEKEGKWIDVQNYANTLAPANAEEYKRTAEYTNVKENFEQVQFAPYVHENVYYNFPIREISDYTKVICTIVQVVHDEQGNQKENYKGSASITLYNHMQVPSTYNLNIENGTQVFQYDGKGNSPASPQLEKPIKILPLTFTFIDDEGNEVSYDQIVNNGYVEWMIPKTNTLLISKGNDQTKKIDYDTATGTDRTLAADYDIYKNISSFSYTIAPVYDAKLTNNYIRLDIKYKDMLFSAYTDFTFPKDGDPGTNGTDYVVKISPTTSTDRVYISNKIPEVLFDDDGNIVDKLNFQVYNNSRIVENAEASLWTCPPKGTSDDSDRGNTYISKYNNGIIEAKNIASDTVLTDKPINIVRAHYKNGDLNQYAEYPICYNYLENDAGYRFKIKPKTGFKYVVYQEDGTSPQYDNTLPFEVIVEKKDDNTDYYIIQDSGLDYEWLQIGEIEVDSNRNNGLNENQKYYKPKDKFDGSNLTTAIVVKIKQNNNYIGYIHVPIYMILNRYGHSALNNWDGNSIQLGKDAQGNSTGTILAPQMGAGKKQIDNSFTGVLMGEVMTPSSTDTGIMGYNHGVRSIFMDAETGKTVLGKQGAGQIKIDPSLVVKTSTQDSWDNAKEAGLLYSNNYTLPTETNITDGTNKGKKGITLNVQTYKPGNGMIIDLSTPQIGFGSGHFYVSKEGNIHASGDGDIAGWKISDDAFYKHDGTNKTGMRSSGDPAFYAGTNSQTTETYNFYVNHDGYLFSKSGQVAGWNIRQKDLWKQIGTGTSAYLVGMNSDPDNSDYTVSGHKSKAFFANGNNFYVTHDGYLRSDSGKIGNWNISASQLWNKDASNNQLKLSPTTGISIVNGQDNGKKFTVNNQGYLTSTSGKIGGWNITGTELWAVGKTGENGIRINSNGSLTGGKASNSTAWNIDTQGRKASLKNGGSWAINADGSSTFKNITVDYLKASNVDVEGDVYANYIKANTGGQIGGWNISSSSLSANDITLSSAGSISNGSNWTISSNGDAYFKNIYGTIKSGETLSTGGSGSNKVTLGSGGSSWGGGPLGGTMTSKDITLFKKITLKRVSASATPEGVFKCFGRSKALSECVGVKTNGTTSVTGTISGSVDGKPISGQCTINIPIYDIDIKNDYRAILDVSTIGANIATGLTSTSETLSVLCSSDPNQDVDQD